MGIFVIPEQAEELTENLQEHKNYFKYYFHHILHLLSYGGLGRLLSLHRIRGHRLSSADDREILQNQAVRLQDDLMKLNDAAVNLTTLSFLQNFRFHHVSDHAVQG